MIGRDFLAPLGLEVDELARHVGLDCARLAAMLRGEMSFDPESAARVARAFELPAEHIVRMQVAYDLAQLKADPTIQGIGVLPAPAALPFPEDALHGWLAEAADEGYGGFTWFFREEVRENPLDPLRGLHSLWVGDRLRVYDAKGCAFWTGPVMKNLDGRMLLPYVRFQAWIEWFYCGLRADLALGPEHRAFLERLA